jgi:hypothetical protein
MCISLLSENTVTKLIQITVWAYSSFGAYPYFAISMLLDLFHSVIFWSKKMQAEAQLYSIIQQLPYFWNIATKHKQFVLLKANFYPL